MVTLIKQIIDMGNAYPDKIPLDKLASDVLHGVQRHGMIPPTYEDGCCVYKGIWEEENEKD